MKLIILIFFFPFFCYSKNISCIESKNLIQIAKKTHVENIKIDKPFAEKVLINYIYYMDPQGLFLLDKEYKDVLSSYPYKNIIDFLNSQKNNSCENLFKNVNVKLKKGIQRYNVFLKTIKLKDDKSNIKIDFDSEDEEYEYSKKLYKNEKELKKAVYASTKQSFENSGKDFEEVISNKTVSENIFEDLNEVSYITKIFMRSFDPHSDYFDEKEIKNFNESLSGRKMGIGFNYKIIDDGIEVLGIFSGSEMEKSEKVTVGDVIVEVDGKDLKGTNKNKIMELLNKDEGSEVVFKIRKNKDNSEIVKEIISLSRNLNIEENYDDILYTYEKVNLKYSSFEVPSLKIESKMIVENNKNLLYIKIPQFYSDQNTKTGTTTDTLSEYLKYKKNGIDAIVLDLRGNPGGFVDEGINLAGLFLGNRTIVMLKSRIQNSLFYSQLISQTALSPVPLIQEKLVVLTDKLSASSSEIFVGAIKDYQRGLIIGDSKTFGKGTVQYIDQDFQSINIGSLKITTGVFYRPNGTSTQIQGIESDVVLSTKLKNKKIGEKYTQFPLPVNKISASYDFDSKFYKNNISIISKKYNQDKHVYNREEFLKKSLEITLDYLSD